MTTTVCPAEDPMTLARAFGLPVQSDAARPRLSPRQQEVVSLHHQGYSHKEIGLLLFIGVETVKTHLRLAREAGALMHKCPHCGGEW